MVCVDGSGPAPLRVVGFTSSTNAHGHLFKHVIRLCALPKKELRSQDDPERWDKLMKSPPLIKALEPRRRAAIEALAAIEGCALGLRERTSDSVCHECTHQQAIREVELAFADIFTEYERVAERALAWGFSHPSQRGPRVLAFRDEGLVKIEAVDERHVRVLGVFSTSPSDITLITCHRVSGRRPLKLRWLDMERERAAHARDGTLVTIESAPTIGE
jgi:hypothetical protein